MTQSLTPPLDPELVKQAMILMEPAQRIALLAHERPDGDCIGSALGLAHMLRLTGKTCVPVCVDPAPRTLSFLPDVETLQNTLGDENFDLVIALDAGDFPRFGALYERHRAFLERVQVINIDHHVTSNGCGQVNIIDPSAASTTELLVLFQQQAGLPLDTDAALCLLTGMITDSGAFMFTSTTPRTMQASAILLQAGAVAEVVAKNVFSTHPLAQARLQAAAITNANTAFDGRLIWSFATDETLAATGAIAEMDDNISGTLRDIEGVQVAAFFKNFGNPATTRLSLRCAAPYNAAEICAQLGGGGHPRAAGATINQPIQEVMPLVVEMLKQEIQKL